MFLWAAGDFDRQGIRLSGSATEHYHRSGSRERVRTCACMCAHVCVRAYLRTSVCLRASVSANMP